MLPAAASTAADTPKGSSRVRAVLLAALWAVLAGMLAWAWVFSHNPGLRLMFTCYALGPVGVSVACWANADPERRMPLVGKGALVAANVGIGALCLLLSQRLFGVDLPLPVAMNFLAVWALGILVALVAGAFARHTRPGRLALYTVAGWFAFLLVALATGLLRAALY